MATLLEVTIALPPVFESDTIEALKESMAPYTDSDSVVVTSDSYGVRIVAQYSKGDLDSVSDNALTAACCVIEAANDALPKKAVVTIKELMP